MDCFSDLFFGRDFLAPKNWTEKLDGNNWARRKLDGQIGWEMGGRPKIGQKNWTEIWATEKLDGRNWTEMWAGRWGAQADWAGFRLLYKQPKTRDVRRDSDTSLLIHKAPRPSGHRSKNLSSHWSVSPGGHRAIGPPAHQATVPPENQSTKPLGWKATRLS